MPKPRQRVMYSWCTSLQRFESDLRPLWCKWISGCCNDLHNLQLGFTHGCTSVCIYYTVAGGSATYGVSTVVVKTSTRGHTWIQRCLVEADSWELTAKCSTDQPFHWIPLCDSPSFTEYRSALFQDQCSVEGWNSQFCFWRTVNQLTFLHGTQHV